jgi:hypothetical protein
MFAQVGHWLEYDEVAFAVLGLASQRLSCLF